MTSRKKIRGYKRKRRTLENWKNYLLSYPIDPESVKRSPIIFRLRLAPFYWFHDKNPSLKFTGEIFKTFSDIFRSLKDNSRLKENNIHFQIWMFYPRTIKSIIIISSKEKLKIIEDKISSKETQLNPPKIIRDAFPHSRWNIGRDLNFTTDNPFDENPKWISHEKGKIWIPFL